MGGRGVGFFVGVTQLSARSSARRGPACLQTSGACPSPSFNTTQRQQKVDHGRTDTGQNGRQTTLKVKDQDPSVPSVGSGFLSSFRLLLFHFLSAGSVHLLPLPVGGHVTG